MDALELLSQHHREVDRLIEKIEKTDNRGSNSRQELFAALRQQLELHTRLEEDIFYPEMQKYATIKGLIGNAVQEHDEIRLILGEIAAFSAEDDEWSEMLNELKLAVQEHVRGEEGRLFPAARKELDQCRIDELGRQVDEMRQRASA